MIDSPIKAYLYTQYMDDDNIQAFITAYNQLSNEIYQWMKNANLPIFTGNYSYGEQLKWIAKGIYSQDPPIIVTSKKVSRGPYNTLLFNQQPYNTRLVKTTSNQITVSDDVFKRIMTWNFYKGDGFNFTIPWLKRRIMRFLTGVNGTDVINDQQFNISVTFGDVEINVYIHQQYTNITDGSMYDQIGYNLQQFGQIDTEITMAINLQFATVFKQAFDSGLMHMPFWSKVNVSVVG